VTLSGQERQWYFPMSISSAPGDLRARAVGEGSEAGGETFLDRCAGIWNNLPRERRMHSFRVWIAVGLVALGGLAYFVASLLTEYLLPAL
jgi:hypothetical protein